MEERKDLTKLQFDELVGSLMSHEERLKETFEAIEKAFSSKLQITKNEDASSSSTKSHQGQGKWQSKNYSRGRGRGGSSRRGSFRGRGRGIFDKRNVQCYHCNRYGHFERECRLREGKNANYAQESGEYPRDHLFLSYAKGENTSKDVWYLDSRCSNHMTRNEKLFSAKDGSFKSKIQLGDDKSLEVASKEAMEAKSEALDTFKKFKALVENERGCKIKCLRTDRVGEFCSKDFQSYCDMNGIRRQHTTAYTPQQNGIAERKNRVVVEMARCMLQTKGLGNSYWGDAVATALYILNHSPTSALENMTPYEA
eukprot:PITA_21326